METMERIKELSYFGGFLDFDYLKRTLVEEFQQMESCFKQAFDMPFATISKKIFCRDLLPLFPFESSSRLVSSKIPVSVSYYKEASHYGDQQRISGYMYILFQVPEESLSNSKNCIGITRGFAPDFGNSENGQTFAEAALLSIPEGYSCVDLSLYKEGEIILLLNEMATTSESSGNACMMLIQVGDLPFVSVSRSANLTSWKLDEILESLTYLQLEKEKVRTVPHSVVPPLAVSASRGVACIFAARKRALVYILEEDEDEISDSE